LGKHTFSTYYWCRYQDKYPEKTVLCNVSAEKIPRNSILILLKNNRNDFIHFYQIIDVLIIDDVQFLSGRNKVHKMSAFIFLTIFKPKWRSKVILTSDSLPVITRY
jgi:chromosomal replication initiator protein